MPAVGLAGCLRLDTADDIVIARVFHGQTAVEQRGNDDFVVVVSGKTDTGAGQLSRLDEKFVRGTVPDTDREGRHRQKHMLGCLDAHERQVVCRVHTVGRLTACDQILEQGVTGKALGGCRVTNLVEVI